MGFNFPDAPIVGQVFQGLTWDGEKWVAPSQTFGSVRYDLAQSLNATQQAQARANIAVQKKNYVINGAMQISQENGTTAGTGTGYVPVDMFTLSRTGTTGTTSTAQVASRTPGGSPNRIRCTVTAADAVVDAADSVMLWTAIEGLRAADLMAGTVNPKFIIIQFGVKAPAGTYCISVQNAASNRSYIGTYVISAGEANTDVVKAVALQLDLTGTWATDNTVGMYINFVLMAGSALQGTGAGWLAGNLTATSSQFNFMATNGNVFELFDVGLYEGTVAPPFMMPAYAEELLLCQRYWEASMDFGVTAAAAGITGAYAGQSVSTTFVGSTRFRVTKRIIAGACYSASGSGAINMVYDAAVGDKAAVTGSGGVHGFRIVCSTNITANSGVYWHYIANARL